MKRWHVVSGAGACDIYAETPERASSLFQEAVVISVKENTCTEHLDYIEKIKASAEPSGTATTKDGSEVSMYYMDICGVKFRFYLMKDLSDGVYYDYIKYQSFPSGKLTYPILWDITTLKKFYQKYMLVLERVDDHRDQNMSVAELRRLKSRPKLFYNKNPYKFWKDDDGFFYACRKGLYPSKRHKDLFKRFGGNKEAVYVTYCDGQSKSHQEWFENESVFMEFFDALCKETPASWATPRYTIRKKGFTDVPPEHRRIVYRLPYFDPSAWLSDNSISAVAKTWANLCDESLVGDGIEDVIETMIKAYA